MYGQRWDNIGREVPRAISRYNSHDAYISQPQRNVDRGYLRSALEYSPEADHYKKSIHSPFTALCKKSYEFQAFDRSLRRSLEYLDRRNKAVDAYVKGQISKEEYSRAERKFALSMEDSKIDHANFKIKKDKIKSKTAGYISLAVSDSTNLAVGIAVVPVVGPYAPLMSTPAAHVAGRVSSRLAKYFLKVDQDGWKDEADAAIINGAASLTYNATSLAGAGPVAPLTSSLAAMLTEYGRTGELDGLLNGLDGVFWGVNKLVGYLGR